MGLNTGGSTSTSTTNPAAAGQVNAALNASGGIAPFATPSQFSTLTPGENLFQSLAMANALPGAQASRALGYVQPGTPGGDQFQSYFQNFIAPVVLNDAIRSGYGGAGGATMEALSRAGQQAAMQGLTSFGMPMAQADMSNLGTGLNAAGLQRQAYQSDMLRRQQLLQSLLGFMPTTTSGSGTSLGPGLPASLLNLGGSILGSLFNGGMLGSAGSLGGQLLSSAGSGISGLFSSLLGGGAGAADFSGVPVDILSGLGDSGFSAAEPTLDLLGGIF